MHAGGWLQGWVGIVMVWLLGTVQNVLLLPVVCRSTVLSVQIPPGCGRHADRAAQVCARLVKGVTCMLLVPPVECASLPTGVRLHLCESAPVYVCPAGCPDATRRLALEERVCGLLKRASAQH
jgi:hypothetical protein